MLEKKKGCDFGWQALGYPPNGRQPKLCKKSLANEWWNLPRNGTTYQRNVLAADGITRLQTFLSTVTYSVTSSARRMFGSYLLSWLGTMLWSYCPLDCKLRCSMMGSPAGCYHLPTYNGSADAALSPYSAWRFRIHLLCCHQSSCTEFR
jgi:hypothetical protein